MSNLTINEENPLQMFLYALKAPESKRQYPRRLKVVLDYLKKGELNDPKNIAIDISNSQVHTPCEYRVFVDDKSDLEYVITLIRQAYEKAN